MKTQLKEFVGDCLRRFDRDDRLQLATQQASAQSRGEALSEAVVPTSCLIPRQIRVPCDLFEVELALMLFDRQGTHKTH